jgi:hypothetical protein
MMLTICSKSRSLQQRTTGICSPVALFPLSGLVAMPTIRFAIHPKIAHAHVSGAQKQLHISSREFFQEMRYAAPPQGRRRNLEILSVS